MMKMKIRCPFNNEKCAKNRYDAKSCLILSENDDLVNLIKKFFEPKGYGVQVSKKGDFENPADFCKFCESAHAAGFGIVIGYSPFQLGFLYGLGKPLILNNTPQWTRDTENINNSVYLEKIIPERLSEELRGAMFVINDKLKKNMVEIFVKEEASSDVKNKLERLSEILLEHDFSLSVIRKHKEVEISSDDKYTSSEIIDEIENMRINMTIEYYLNIGRFFFEINEYTNAIKQFEKALEIDNENIDTLTDMGTAYYYLKKYENAVEYLKRASEIDNENVYALHTMGMSYVHLKKYETAVEYFKNALKIDNYENKYEIFNDLGIVYNYIEEDDKRYDKALECFNESLKIKNNIRAWRNMGATHIHLKRYNEAVACFKNALKIEPGNAKIMYNIGGVYFRLKDYNNAIDFFKKVIDIEPNNADAHHSLGLVYNSLKNYNEAIPCFKRAIDLNPEHIDALWDLGFTYTHLGDYNKALEYFNRAAEIDNEYVDAWNSMGAAYTKLGKYDKAGQCYTKVVQILPRYTVGKLNLAENYVIRGMYDRAFLNANEALKLAKEDKNNRDICMSYFFGIISLLFQPQKINDGKILVNEFIKYFEEVPQRVDWDFSEVMHVIRNSHLGDDFKNLIQALTDLLQTKISVEDFIRMAKKSDI